MERLSCSAIPVQAVVPFPLSPHVPRGDRGPPSGYFEAASLGLLGASYSQSLAETD